MGLLDDLEFLKKRKPNLLADVRQLQGPSEPYLRQQYPEVYGGLGGLLGMAPDEMAGSVLDPNTARVRSGAQIGFPVGTAAQIAPLAPMLAPAVKAGARALGPTAVRMGEGYLQSKGLMPQLDVYHGSPHKFDRFNASKIGTGEGAQAYGHGLYLAESPDVAKGYKDKLSPDTITRVKNDVYNIAGDDNHILTIYDANGKATKTPYLSPDELDKWVGKDAADMLRAKGDGDYKGLNIDFGNLYKVDLPDEQIAKMLDWDKPLSQQPDVMKALKGTKFEPFAQYNSSILGKDFASQAGVHTSVGAEQLRQIGIPGIKYLDGTSRGAGTGTRNFVTFPGEEQSMTILERNGQPMIARTQQQDATPDLLQYQQMLDEDERKKLGGLLFH